MTNEKILIILGIIVIGILAISLIINTQTGTEANTYYYHLDDTVTGYIVPIIKTKLL